MYSNPNDLPYDEMRVVWISLSGKVRLHTAYLWLGDTAPCGTLIAADDNDRYDANDILRTFKWLNILNFNLNGVRFSGEIFWCPLLHLIWHRLALPSKNQIKIKCVVFYIQLFFRWLHCIQSLTQCSILQSAYLWRCAMAINNTVRAYQWSACEFR